MVADIQLLQGKIIDDPEKRTQNIGILIEELAREFAALQSHQFEQTQDKVAEILAENSEPLVGTA